MIFPGVLNLTTLERDRGSGGGFRAAQADVLDPANALIKCMFKPL